MKCCTIVEHWSWSFCKIIFYPEAQRLRSEKLVRDPLIMIGCTLKSGEYIICWCNFASFERGRKFGCFSCNGGPTTGAHPLSTDSVAHKLPEYPWSFLAFFKLELWIFQRFSPYPKIVFDLTSRFELSFSRFWHRLVKIKIRPMIITYKQFWLNRRWPPLPPHIIRLVARYVCSSDPILNRRGATSC